MEKLALVEKWMLMAQSSYIHVIYGKFSSLMQLISCHDYSWWWYDDDDDDNDGDYDDNDDDDHHHDHHHDHHDHHHDHPHDVGFAGFEDNDLW